MAMVDGQSSMENPGLKGMWLGWKVPALPLDTLIINAV
jgi:hypothetical protein